jgi:hypothetical protein
MRTQTEIYLTGMAARVNVSQHFDGKTHWSWATRSAYRNPQSVAEQALESEHFVHRDFCPVSQHGQKMSYDI